MAKVHFKTNVLLKSIIGKDLITDDNIAVLELVKNSFDAGSRKVEIFFQNILSNDDKSINPPKGASLVPIPSDKTSRIIIKDTGKGMSESDLTNKWLNIAYSEKKQKREEYGRVLAGNKGVGRFSCDRLGKFLNIYTKKKGEKKITHLFIDWNKFEVEDNINLEIQDISLEIVEIELDKFKESSGFEPFERGTILEINHLRNTWDYDKILDLKRQLERLINPNQAFKKDTFDIEIIAKELVLIDKDKEEYARVNGPVKNKIFEKLNFKSTSIESIIDAEGKTIITTLQDRGRQVFRLVEHNAFALLKNIKVTVYYLNPYSKIYFNKQTGIRSVDFGSIFLFINGFRIPPYGDANDDWLGIEKRKGQGHSRYLGTRELVGQIEVNDEDEQFKIISSRSGVVNNAPFEQLTKSTSPFGYFYRTFRRLERFVAEGIKFDSATEDERVLEQKIKAAGENWLESDEVYREDTLTKDQRVLSLINNIISAGKSEVVSLEINEDFISEIIQLQTEKSEKELNKLIAEVSSKKLDSNQISKLVSKLESEAVGLSNFSGVVEKYVPNTSGNFSNLEKLQESLNAQLTALKLEKEELEKEFKAEQEKLKKQLQIAEEEKQKLEEEEKRLKAELEAEKKERLFNSDLAGTDIKEIVSLQHHIDRAVDKINDNIDFLISGIGENFPKETLLKYINKISLEGKKISTVAQFVTNANFNVKATAITKDLNRFIREYIVDVHQHYGHLKLNKELLQVNLKSDLKPFIMTFRPLEIIMIIDNLYSNSFKAKAKEIDVTLNNIDDKFLEVIFADDGPSGIPDSVVPRIFNLGFTTTEGGSGIGLYHVKQLVESIKGKDGIQGKIEVDNTVSKGVLFKIIIPKHES